MTYTDFAIFNDEGLLEDGFHGSTAEADAKQRVIDEPLYQDDDGIYVAAVCDDHKEEGAATCQYCYGEFSDDDAWYQRRPDDPTGLRG